jgi:dCMP deaminase
MTNNKRPQKIDYYLNIAKEVSSRSTCLRKRYGAIIVNNDEIVSTGYNGAPRKCENCHDLGFCYRKQNNIPSGSNYELCKSVHAEQNAIISAGRNKCIDSTLYIYRIDVDTDLVCDAYPCIICTKLIINCGIKNIIISRVFNSTDYGWEKLLLSDMYKRYNTLFDKSKGV